MNDDKSRRRFLKLGIGFGVASVAGAVTGKLIADNAKKDDNGAGEKVKVLTSDGKLIEVDAEQVNLAKKQNIFISRDAAHEGIPNRKFVMVIDLAKCKNARKCIDACQEGHYLPKDHEWMKLFLLQDSDTTAPYWFPKPCFHCDNPLCVSVCPVGATYKRSDGIVLIDTERCIGCKFCMTGCPYSSRVFHWKKSDVKVPADLKYSPETAAPSKEGTVGKCVFCPDKLRKGELPRCASACPMGTIYFGDILEDTVTNGTETVRFSELIQSRGGYRHLESLGTLPRVYYLPPVDRSFPVERGYEDLPQEIKDRYKDTSLGDAKE
jgi:molybdopterin-containing oxidoreductase family iron-sulfur binding subunit